MTRVSMLFVALGVLLVGGAAFAFPSGYGPLPGLDKSDASRLGIRVVEYRGGTNGKMVVEVLNEGAKAQTFHAKGLYFVPKGDPDKAPQRLGAAGPFRVKDGLAWKNHEKLQLAPKQKVRLELDVFCIDSHRSSPSSSTQFGLAVKRMPMKLANEIDVGTKSAMKKGKVDSASGAKNRVQSLVWKTRNKAWIKLEGEREYEKKRRSGRSQGQTNNIPPQTQRSP